MPSSPRSRTARFAASCEDGRRETLRVGGRMAAHLRAARGRRPEGFGQGCAGGLPGAARGRRPEGFGHRCNAIQRTTKVGWLPIHALLAVADPKGLGRGVGVVYRALALKRSPTVTKPAGAGSCQGQPAQRAL